MQGCPGKMRVNVDVILFSGSKLFSKNLTTGQYIHQTIFSSLPGSAAYLVPLLSPYEDFHNSFTTNGTLELVQSEETPEVAVLKRNGTTICQSVNNVIVLYFKRIDLETDIGRALLSEIIHAPTSNLLVQNYFISFVKNNREFCCDSVQNWKEKLTGPLSSTSKFNWAIFSEYPVFLYLDDALTEIRRSNPDYNFPQNDTLTELNEFYVFAVADNQIVPIPIQPLMLFEELELANAVVQAEGSEDSEAVAILKESFQHLLSNCGQSTLSWLKARILVLFKKWTNPSEAIIAPIASLSQGSGSGKSKLAVELIKDVPGFYLVLRTRDDSTGYPKNNFLSKILINLAKASDSPEKLSDKPFRNHNVGLILFSLCKIIVLYMKDWRRLIVASIQRHSESPEYKQLNAADKIALHHRIALAACAELGRLFDDNDAFTCPYFDSIDAEIIGKLKRRDGTALKVKDIAKYIKFILVNPSGCFLKEDIVVGRGSLKTQASDSANSDTEEIESPSSTQDSNDTIAADAIKAMKRCLELFPFIFVLDEADQLNDLKPETFSRGFEHLRRALSYLADGTNVFFLSLGTRSTVHDLNPEPRDDSKRYIKKKKLLEPIVLLSNTSIFAKDSVPIEALKLSHDVLKNPVFFKLHVTQGHPIWSSVAFDKIVSLAEIKLKNGSAENYKYALVLWMIRAGLMANPLDLNTRSLIASQMATLFNLSKDLARMIVFYPSEPVLAMACRSLLKELNREVKDDTLFTVLDELFEAVQIDRGYLSEIIGTMIALRAIDFAGPLQELKPDSIAELNDLLPEFKKLWAKKQYILEPDIDTNNDNDSGFSEPISFSDYHVTSVEKFLGKLLPPGKFEEIKAKLPSSTLAGLVNASHAVKLIRTRDGLEFDGTRFETMNLPRADDRIADKNCNLIDDALLKLGLAHQCCFLMPDRYYGFDLIVPVLLADGSFTFIGIQFKAAGASIAEPLEKMQARFHYVKCPSTAEPHSCDKCSQNVSEIFANQICLLISLDPRDTSDFRSKEEYSFKADARQKLFLPELKAVLNANPGASKSYGQAVKTIKTGQFIQPLVCVRERVYEDFEDNPDQNSTLDYSLALFSSLWDDSFVQLPGNKLKLSRKRDHEIDFVPDPYLHRQYCIGIRGMDSFRHLFNPSSAIDVAKKLLCAETDFFGRVRRDIGNDLWTRLSYLKSILYDARLNYPDANSTLAAWRGITGPIGFKALEPVESRFLKSQVDAFCKTSAHLSGETRASLILSPEVPSRHPALFKSLLAPLTDLSRRFIPALQQQNELSSDEEN